MPEGERFVAPYFHVPVVQSTKREVQQRGQPALGVENSLMQVSTRACSAERSRTTRLIQATIPHCRASNPKQVGRPVQRATGRECRFLSSPSRAACCLLSLLLTTLRLPSDAGQLQRSLPCSTGAKRLIPARRGLQCEVLSHASAFTLLGCGPNTYLHQRPDLEGNMRYLPSQNYSYDS